MKRVLILASYVAIAVADVAAGQTYHPSWTPTYATLTPTVKPETVVIRWGQGGKLADHRQRFADYQATKAKVELRGPCYSACTLITAYVSKADLCIAEDAFFAFHAVRSLERHELMPGATATMYWQQPGQIRSWIDRMGGHENLPLDGYWTMYDRELWAMGYPKCN